MAVQVRGFEKSVSEDMVVFLAFLGRNLLDDLAHASLVAFRSDFGKPNDQIRSRHPFPLSVPGNAHRHVS